MGLGLAALWVGGHLLSTPLSKKVPGEVTAERPADKALLMATVYGGSTRGQSDEHK